MIIQDTLDGLKLGAPASFQHLTMFPLLGRDAEGEDYLTLDEALASKTVHITEVSEGGSVPELRFVNEGDRQVLLMDGEEVVGAKQNRTLNITILAAPHSTLLLPVTCVEAGRWAHNSAEFQASPQAHYAAGRAQKQRSVSESLFSGGNRVADQGEVWADIDAKAMRMASQSPTHAMAAMYLHHETHTEEFVHNLPFQEQQRGAVFAIGGQVIGLDLFDRADTFRKLLSKIVRSYALDALECSPQEQPSRDPSEIVADFLKSIAGAQMQSFAAVGIGEDVRLHSARLAGGALVTGGRVVHLSVFAAEPATASDSPESTLSRASTRRRNRQ
ncbi:MAG: hypothetical protein JWL77_1540 [Chthonomonadaceae bacterium]|nr:hypothetical protein [Chthonomonadaceae bacterium]